MDSILSYKKSGDDFYCLLRCDESSNTEQILAEYKVLSLKYHPDKNPGDPNAVEKFQKLKKAKEILTDAEKRSLYDKWRRCNFSMPFEQFLNLSKAAHTSIHWACKKQKDLMLENVCNASETNLCNQTCNVSESYSCNQTVDPEGRENFCKNKAWERDPANEVLRKFRNYEI
ncbi:dnaJ homolog subfamily C member 12 [Nephila pilipes]|uniref:DnaJ homolog subfamily C member 12 n=1 Tax=Nephila pilipes TaxID=299642 RepID=A0A8X6I5W7_NEPPI|nr:dnaJ homolog subfamily C member 12 [Nephila pilipes]